MFTAEIALYPENNTSGDEIVNNTIQSVNDSVNTHVDHMSTRISGNEEEVWSAIQKMSRQADASGEFSMVITLTNH